MKANSKKLKATANIAKNRLYITIVAGKLTKENLDKLYTDIRFCVADLTPGFDVINDISGCTLAALSGIPTFKKITNFLITSRVGKIIRVIDERKTVVRQVINFASKVQGYSVTYVNSLEAAENKLAESQQLEGLRFYLHSQPVKYRLGEAEGEGYISDISTSGCAIKSATLLPAVEESISFSTTFNKKVNLTADFQILGRVARVEEESFSIKFETLDDEQKESLWERLVHESQLEKGD
ncbi:MAG: PilZ domain-containing protein [Desulfobulbaceae bacterium]|nr:PilZ domain-containing protein [Desulfobulbaceae bacterium]